MASGMNEAHFAEAMPERGDVAIKIKRVTGYS